MGFWLREGKKKESEREKGKILRNFAQLRGRQRNLSGSCAGKVKQMKDRDYCFLWKSHPCQMLLITFVIYFAASFVHISSPFYTVFDILALKVQHLR